MTKSELLEIVNKCYAGLVDKGVDKFSVSIRRDQHRNTITIGAKVIVVSFVYAARRKFSCDGCNFYITSPMSKALFRDNAASMMSRFSW